MKSNRQSFRERWKETIAENERQKQEELEKKIEAEERLRFDGKDTALFYKIMWKNFRRNIKDYLLLLICNALVFGCAVVALGMKEILSQQYEEKGMQMFHGLGQIFLNAIIPIAVIAIIVFIMLFFYYIKCRGRNFGVFLTLGMRRKVLYKFVAMEYATVLGMAVLLGGITGAGILVWFVLNSEKYVGTLIPLSAIGVETFGTAIVALLYLCAISLMFARSIFTDFNVGNSTDLRAIGEKIPTKFRKVFIAIGIIMCGVTLARYQNLNNFENVYLLFVFFAGVCLIVRYGMAEYFVHKRKSRKYLKKLMLNSQFFHKSRTASAYVVSLFIVQFCIIFYFLFSIISIKTAQDPEQLYPYDVVCLADDSDAVFFDELAAKYNLEILEFPALRVTAYDSTESKENGMGRPIQGQHVGISESTYHALRKQIDSSYMPKSLGLDSEGKDVYIVYQQDKSIKAHPIGYFSPRNKPLLHIGLPCRMVDVYSKQYRGYDYYQVKGCEIASLTGVFGQGAKENIIVFSDSYFEQAKEFWKTTDIITGEQIEEDEQIVNYNVFQGTTKLVLMNMKDKKSDSYSEQIKLLYEDMEMFEKKHLEVEDEVYSRPVLGRGIYDSSVSYHYMKGQAIKNLVAERLMRITMNYIVIIVFFAMNIMLILIKILSEKELNEKRAEFLNCMGMCKKKRISLICNELIRQYYILPVVFAILAAVLFSVCTVHARMYEIDDIKRILVEMVPIWIGYLLANAMILFGIATIYAHRMEGVKNGRNS